MWLEVEIHLDGPINWIASVDYSGPASRRLRVDQDDEQRHGHPYSNKAKGDPWVKARDPHERNCERGVSEIEFRARPAKANKNMDGFMMEDLVWLFFSSPLPSSSPAAVHSL